MSEPIDPVDQQLIELLEQKSPEELTFEELELLRARLTESPALRAALAQYLQTESYLTQVLGNFSVSPDVIITRAQAEQAAQARPWQWLAGGVVCLLLFGILGAVFVNAMRAPQEPQLAGVSREGNDAEDPAPTEPPAEAPDTSGVETPAAPVEPATADDPVTPIESAEPEKASVPAYTISLPAEQFKKGNVKVDNGEYGSATNVVILGEASKKKNTYVEYEFVSARSGSFWLHLRYASPESRPLIAKVNDKKVAKPFANEATGGPAPQHQKWSNAGRYYFKRGKNSLKLERLGPFPHLNRIVISTEKTVTDETAPAPQPHEIAQVEPWEEALKRPNPPPFLATAFQDFDTSKSLPQVSDLMRWFETVPNQQRRVGDTHTKVGRCGEFDGVFRLRWPWQEKASLRLSLENHNRLRIHCYSGTKGITLVYYQDEGYIWAAYATTRKDEQTHAPESLALAATSEGLGPRTELRFGGPIDLRWHAGELILSRGDIILLRAPLAGIPQHVFFDGRSAFHGIAVVPASDAPPALAAPPEPGSTPSPATLAWTETLTEGATVTKHADGAVEIVANNAKGSGYISAPLDLTTPSEVILEFENVSRGTGVFLSPAKPPSLMAVRFANNTRMNPPALSAVLRSDEVRETDLGFWQERTMTSVRPDKQYVRLLSGAGVVRHAISVDGIHWAEKEEPPANLPAGSTHLCLHYVSAEPNCRIKLNKVTIRPLAVLAQQAVADLLPKVPVLTNAQTPTLVAWMAEVSAKQPAGVTSSAWRRTCAIRSLAAGCDAELGQRLVQLVLDDAEARRLPIDQLLALYQDAFQLVETRHNAAQAQACWNRYFTAAARAASEGQLAYSAVRHAVMTSPVSWRHNLPIDEKVIRLELLQLIYSGKWNEVARFCEQLRFFQQHQRVPLVEWAEATASRQLPGRPGGDSAVSRLRSSWRPLLVEELSKDAYNVLAEMQAILDSDAFDDAARMITSISPDAITGVAPHGRDRQLLVSLPSAIRLAMRDYPQLQQVMNDKFGPLAQLRVRQSIASNNVAGVDLAAVQFEATDAAAEAHRWLGDRALSSGQFARAIAEYERALRTASSALKHDLQARLRLTAAMQGRTVGEAVTRPVSFGETTISPAEFEAIVADMKTANAAGGAQRPLTADEQRTYPALTPNGYEAAMRSRLDGHIGGDPNQEVTRDINALKINWAERQIATLVEDNVLYVTNRFQVAAYNLDNGQRMWQTAPIPGNVMRSRDWTLIPMRPLIVGNTIYVRLLYGASPTLSAFEKATGKLLWTTEQRANEFIVSDPLLIQQKLLALTLVRGDQGQSSLRLTTFDRESGEPVVQQNLVRLNEVWWARRAAEVATLDDSLIATLGGVSLCCDASGNVRWIRRPIGLPPDEESSWVRQSFERPLVADGKAYLAQPGVRSLECVDVETGRLAWSRTLPGIESVIGLEDDRLIVKTEKAFLALAPADGKELWRHARPDVFDAVLLGGPGGMMYVERQPTKASKDRFSPRLVWVDPATGGATSSFIIPTLEDPDPHFGPLVSYKDRIFAFWGRGQNEANRDVVELTPKADAIPTPALAVAQDPWSLQTDPALRLPAERLFPQFALLGAGVNGESGLRDDVYGEKDVLGLCVRAQQPTIFASDISLPANTLPKLRMRFNHRTDQDWKIKLTVQFAGQTLWTQEYGKDQAPQQWKDIEVDLARAAGQTGTLTITAEYLTTAGGEMPTWWKRLEIAP